MGNWRAVTICCISKHKCDIWTTTYMTPSRLQGLAFAQVARGRSRPSERHMSFKKRRRAGRDRTANYTSSDSERILSLKSAQSVQVYVGVHFQNGKASGRLSPSENLTGLGSAPTLPPTREFSAGGQGCLGRPIRCIMRCLKSVISATV